MDRYLKATGNEQTRAISLYKANLKIAQTFHPLIGILEVALRNGINVILSAHFNDPDWIINQKGGFMADSSLTYLNRNQQKITNDFLKSSIEKSEQRFRRVHKPVTAGKIIADQTLGFWTDLFEIHHYRLLLGRPIQVFHNLPPGHGRSIVCNNLNKIRQFRNRINHNEPVCFKAENIDFMYVEAVYQCIIDILTWMDPELVAWMDKLNSVQIAIANAKEI